MCRYQQVSTACNHPPIDRSPNNSTLPNNDCMGIPDCNVLGRYTNTSAYSSSVAILEVLLHVRSSYGRNRNHERITKLIVGGLDELKSV